jgi:hypothetical protein
MQFTLSLFSMTIYICESFSFGFVCYICFLLSLYHKAKKVPAYRNAREKLV